MIRSVLGAIWWNSFLKICRKAGVCFLPADFDTRLNVKMYLINVYKIVK